MSASASGAASDAWLLCVGPIAAHAQVHAALFLAAQEGGAGQPRWVALKVDAASDLNAMLDGLREAHPHPPLMALLVEPPDAHDSAGRELLEATGWPYATLDMGNPTWLQQAEAAWTHANMRARQSTEARQPRWRWVCPDCDDVECERHWLAGARR